MLFGNKDIEIRREHRDSIERSFLSCVVCESFNLRNAHRIGKIDVAITTNNTYIELTEYYTLPFRNSDSIQFFTFPFQIPHHHSDGSEPPFLMV